MAASSAEPTFKVSDVKRSFGVISQRGLSLTSDTTRSFLENPGALPNGERQVKRKCPICHTQTGGSARKAGPSLHRLFGRFAGAATDYSYSDILTGSEIVWSAEAINALFEETPDHSIPGTKMPTRRIVTQTDRDDLIDYLRVATAQGGTEMKAMLVSFVAIAVIAVAVIATALIAVGSNLYLSQAGFFSQDRASGPVARLVA